MEGTLKKNVKTKMLVEEKVQEDWTGMEFFGIYN